MPSALRLIAATSFLLAGCTTEVMQGDAGRDASAEAADEASSDASFDLSLDAVPEATSDAPEESLDVWVKPDVQEVAANREVRLHVKNEGALPVFLALGGVMCRSWQVDRLEAGEWKMLALSLSNVSEFCSCQATCDAAGNQNNWFTEIAPGGEFVVPWDGRSYVTWIEEHTCTIGQSGKWTTVEGVQQPAVPGHYRVTVGLEAAVPGYCSYSESSDDWHCSLVFPWAEPPGIEKMCPASLNASAEFDIPASGDVDVTVSFPVSGPCEPTGTWEVTAYECSMPPPKDELTIFQDGNGGVTGFMTAHVPSDGGSPEASSSVTIDPSKCLITAASSSTWLNGDAPQCDLRELTAELHGDKGYGLMRHTYCNGHAPDSNEARRYECTAVLTRK